MALLFFGFVQLINRPNMALLFGQLDSNAAGEVVLNLEQRNVAYFVKGDSIFVEAGLRDELRMTLASEGLPAFGSKGYELLDSFSGFGTTAQMFDVAYWRAKEGELARTVTSLAAVSGARVHIANTNTNLFQREIAPTASVFLTETQGTVDPAQARAIRFLVASAVAGMLPENVSVVDSQGRLISSDLGTANGSPDDREKALRERVQRIVEARVGQGNAVVEISIEAVTESESILERRFDPEGRVVISTDTEETSTQSDNGPAGGVTVASNLPDGDAAEGIGSSSQNSETRERVNYEVSETTREITRLPGAIRRVTVAVLVNGSTVTNEAGIRQFEPLPDVELSALEDLVSSAVGLDENRGDRITIRSMAFEEKPIAGTEAAALRWYSSAADLTSLLKAALFGLVALVLGLFVVRPVLIGSPVDNSVSAPLALPEIREEAMRSVLSGEIDNPSGDAQELPMVFSPEVAKIDEVNFEGLANSGDDPVERLRTLIESRKEETVEILRSWLGEPEEAS